MLTACVKSSPLNDSNIALVECPPVDEELHPGMTVKEFKAWVANLTSEYKLCRDMVHKAIIDSKEK